MKKLVIIDRHAALEPILQLSQVGQWAGWSRKRDNPAEPFIVLEVEHPELVAYCLAHPSCELVPHSSTSTKRLKTSLKTKLGAKLKADAETVADLLEDLGIDPQLL